MIADSLRLEKNGFRPGERLPCNSGPLQLQSYHYCYSFFIIRLQMLSPQTPALKVHNTEYNPIDDSRMWLFSLPSSHFQVLDPADTSNLQGSL